jgi:polysaccharide biosynthesis transport protein
MASSNGRSGLPARVSQNGLQPDVVAHDATRGGDALDGDSVDVKSVLALLRRHLFFILAVTLLVSGATAYVVLSKRAEYQASALIRLKDVRGALTAGIGDAGGLQQMMMGRMTDPLLSEMEVLRSRAVAERVVDGLGLRLRSRDPAFSPSLIGDAWVDDSVLPDTIALAFAPEKVTASTGTARAEAAYGAPVQLPGIRFTVREQPAVARADLAVVSREVAVGWLLAGLSARQREMTNVIDVHFTTGDPEYSARIVNSAINHFQSLNQTLAQEQSHRRRVFIEDQLASTDSAMAEVQLELSAFRRREQVYSSREQFAAGQTTLMGLDVRREELEAERRMLESLLARATSATASPSRGSESLRALVSAPGIASNPVVTGLYTRLVQYETVLDSLTTGRLASSANHPDVQRYTALTTTARADILAAARSHLEAVRARVQTLDELKQRATTELQGMPDAEAEEVRLVLQMETVKRIGEQLREEYQKARVTEVVEAGQVEILSPAVVPERPVPQRRKLKLLLGTMVGLILGASGAFLRENLDTAITGKEDLERFLQVPNLGVVPQADRGDAGSRLLRLPLPLSLRLRGQTARPGGTSELIAAHLPNSSGAEAYRVLRTNLIFSQAVNALRTLVVTSSLPGEGKTTTTANLAVAFAQQGLRVALVDADLRRSRLHVLFGAKREPGLTQLVLGLATLDEVAHVTEVDGLHLIPAGALPPNPAELLGGSRMRETLELLGTVYDMVLIDTPPLLAAADAAVLGAGADGVLMVVRAGHTDRSQALQAIQQLDAVGARVIGATLNDVDSLLARNGGYYGYYQYRYAEA